VDNVGALSMESGDIQSIGLSPGQVQLGLSYNRTQLEFKMLNYAPIDTGIVIQTLLMSAGLGVTDGLSLWMQIPRIQATEKAIWEFGDPAIGFRWRPIPTTASRRLHVFINEGFVFPVRRMDPSGDWQNGAVRSVKSQGVYLNRFVAELWFLTLTQRTFGTQLLWDFALNENSNGFNPGHVFQLTVHTLDYRFSKPGIIPYFALSYRNKRSDQFEDNIVANSAGWFVQGVAALDVRISPTEHITFSVSAPLIVGIEGMQMRQVNFGLTLRSTSASGR